jgi:parallel beta-helix repeat protein
MRRWTIELLMLACLAAASAAPAGAQCDVFVRAGFVSPGGPPDGQSPESAFPTIKEGARAATVQGDVVCVGPGVYEEGNIEFATSGDAQRPIEIRADASGQSTGDAPGAVRLARPVDSAASENRTGFLVRGRHDVVIDGFEISGFADAGIQVRADADGISSAAVTLRNNVVTHSRTGIDVTARSRTGIGVTARDAVVVQGNTTVGNEQSGISIMGCIFETQEGRCREISGGPVTPLVSNNRSGGNGAQGILIRSADDGVIQNNVIFANLADGIQLRDCNDTQVLNNLVYANGEHGLSVGRVAAAVRTVVLNNTFFANGTWGIEIGDPRAASPGAAVVNNIVWQNQNGIGVLRENLRPSSVCGYLAGFNLLLDSYGPETPRNVFDRAADPLFVDPVGPDGVLGGEFIDGAFIDRSMDDDFHLRQPGGERVSPAIDAGSVRTADLGLAGSTADDGRPDGGVVDIGFHYGASPAQTVMFRPPFMPLYVRTSGSDGASGRTPFRAFHTIGRAAREAAAGVTVVVGPGRYFECNLKAAGRNKGLATFLADPTGDQTGDAPGAVIVDAGECIFDDRSGTYQPGETGFDISSSCGVVIDGFHVTGAKEDAIRIDDHCDGAVLRNNVVFDNGARGIRVVDSLNVRIVNNLLHTNRAGIALGGTKCPATGPCDNGSRKAVIEFNTSWNHEFNGIQVGDGLGVSSHGTVRYNVTGLNRKNGIEVGDDQRRRENLQGFKSYRNLVGDSYGAGVRGADDLLVSLASSPSYLDPSTIDPTGNWLDDQHFRLAQTAAGQPNQSRAVDYGDITALVAGLDGRSTRSDGEPDAGNADLGYHYPRRGPLAGDCDGDGTVRINELIMAVSIALGSVPMAECPPVDADGNGTAEINEVVGAVANALRS